MDQPGISTHQWHIPHVDAGQRLDRAIGLKLGQSRQQVKTLLEQGRVTRNEKRVGVSHKGDILPAGTRLTITLPGPDGQWCIIPEPDAPLCILAQGEGYLVVDKPAGQGVHPLTPDETGTLLNAAVGRFPQLQGVGEDGLRSGVVHRLDLDTSGVLIIAITQQRWKLLRQAFSNHQTVKRYTAVVLGHPGHPGHPGHGRPEHPKQVGRYQAHLAITRHKPAYVSVLPEATGQSRWCDLSWQVIRSLPKATVLDIQLGTGFLHQIRAMMAHLGHPVAGDLVYSANDLPSRGSQSAGDPSRLMLHAQSLTIGDIHATSPLPVVMEQYIAQLADDAPNHND